MWMNFQVNYLNYFKQKSKMIRNKFFSKWCKECVVMEKQKQRTIDMIQMEGDEKVQQGEEEEKIESKYLRRQSPGTG